MGVRGVLWKSMMLLLDVLCGWPLNIQKRSEAAKLLFKEIFVLNWVKHIFAALWVSLKISAILAIIFKHNNIFANFLEILLDKNVTSTPSHVRWQSKNLSVYFPYFNYRYYFTKIFLRMFINISFYTFLYKDNIYKNHKAEIGNKYYVHTCVIYADWLDFILFISRRWILKDLIILPFSRVHTQKCETYHPGCEFRIYWWFFSKVLKRHKENHFVNTLRKKCLKKKSKVKLVLIFSNYPPWGSVTLWTQPLLAFFKTHLLFFLVFICSSDSGIFSDIYVIIQQKVQNRKLSCKHDKYSHSIHCYVFPRYNVSLCSFPCIIYESHLKHTD